MFSIGNMVNDRVGEIPGGSRYVSHGVVWLAKRFSGKTLGNETGENHPFRWSEYLSTLCTQLNLGVRNNSFDFYDRFEECKDAGRDVC